MAKSHVITFTIKSWLGNVRYIIMPCKVR